VSSGTKVTDRRAPTGAWRRATIREVTHPTSHGVALRIEVRDRIAHWAGQHYVVRLTAEDGYTAQRSYSVASAPGDELVELYVERLEDGEVSTYLADVAAVGDELDVRGPIGGWFVWTGDRPAVGVAGGSGVVPLIAMQRLAVSLGQVDLFRLVVSARTAGDVLFAEELEQDHDVVVLTRETTNGGRAAGRLTTTDLQPMLVADATYFVCGSPAFTESASDLLCEVGVTPSAIRVESFGPSA
jgi:ferredoxin-NADP reductase